jgi:hypothetical protein
VVIGRGADPCPCQLRYGTGLPVLIDCSTMRAARATLSDVVTAAPEWQAMSFRWWSVRLEVACPLEGLGWHLIYACYIR